MPLNKRNQTETISLKLLQNPLSLRVRASGRMSSVVHTEIFNRFLYLIPFNCFQRNNYVNLNYYYYIAILRTI